MVVRLAQAHIDSEHGPVNVYAVICKLGFGQVKVRYMHPIQTSRNRVPRIEVISNSAAHVHGKRKILSLRPDDAQRFLCVNIPEPQASIKVGCQSPMARYKIASNTHDPRDVVGFRAPRNYSEGSAGRQIPITPKKMPTANVIHLPTERSDDGHQSVVKRRLGIPIA